MFSRGVFLTVVTNKNNNTKTREGQEHHYAMLVELNQNPAVYYRIYEPKQTLKSLTIKISIEFCYCSGVQMQKALIQTSHAHDGLVDSR